MATIPHFDYPFRFQGPQPHAAVVEQDSMDDIVACLTTVLLTEEGQRIELPEFGIESFLFSLQPVPEDDLYHAIADQEPRALALISQQPDPLNYLTALVEVDIKSNNPKIGES